MDKIFKHKEKLDLSFQIKVKDKKETIRHNTTARQLTRQLQNRTGDSIKCLYLRETHDEIKGDDILAHNVAPG